LDSEGGLRISAARWYGHASLRGMPTRFASGPIVPKAWGLAEFAVAPAGHFRLKCSRSNSFKEVQVFCWRNQSREANLSYL
jgi:hypothetical protein